MTVSAEERTIPVREGEELDRERIEAFLREQLSDLPDEPLRIRQFPTGSSNLTYLLSVGAWQAVLRRPPLGPVPPKAHDMEREAGILRRLHPAFPLAPRSLLVCNDPDVMDVPFHVMEYRSGTVVAHEFPAGTEATEELCDDFADVVLNTLLDLHAVDYEAAGLGDLGHPEGFLVRQVRGWIGRYDKSRTNESPDVEVLTERLAENVPPSPPPTIIHNDYHLKNLLFDPDDPLIIRAVLDWEMATVGDPLMDLAVFLSYWPEPGDPPAIPKILANLPLRPGFPARKELIHRYGERSGRDVSRMGWYLPFAYFKLAVILQQIYARWVRGQTRDPRFAGFGQAVTEIVDHARELLE
ncbi:MAG: phosphotransferase family protein [Longimicrobiales bacterium]